MKDKSAWRKSNLNVANSTEETKTNSVRHRHNLSSPSMTQVNNENNFQFVNENSNRKELISSLGERPATDKLTLYIRGSNDLPKLESEKSLSLSYVPRQIRDSQQSIDSNTNNKVDIDQDNIETPPTIRRVFIPTPVDKREPVAPTPCRRLMGRSKETKVLFLKILPTV